MLSTIDDFITAVRGKFDGLASRLGLHGPTVLRKNMYFQLGYFGDVLGLEILVEFDHFFIFAMPFRIRNKDEIPVGLVDEEGAPRKMYVQEALEKLGIAHGTEDEELRRLGGDVRHCEAMALILSGLVERAWNPICEHAQELFPPSSAVS